LFGLDSGIEPVHVVLKLAQERTLYVPAVEKVYEPLTGVEPPGESEATVPASNILTVYEMALSAIWKMLGKLEAGPVPILETVAENWTL